MPYGYIFLSIPVWSAGGSMRGYRMARMRPAPMSRNPLSLARMPDEVQGSRSDMLIVSCEIPSCRGTLADAWPAMTDSRHAAVPHDSMRCVVDIDA